MFRYGDWFFTNSNFAGKKVEDLGCPKEKLSVPGLPVDDHRYPYKARSRKDHIRILTVARLVEKKGLEYSIRAVAECMKMHKGLKYDIIGEGPLRGELTRLTEELGFSGKINLLGNQNKSDVISHMLDSDIFILTSITADDGETEGLGMVLLESQLTGLPVIATLHNGFTDAVINGESGFLVPEKDIAATVERLDFLLNNPRIWEELGRAGRKHVLENYSERVYLKKITDQIKRLCK